MTHVAVLSGGVGGAKFLEGIYRIDGAPRLRAIVNTGDDFEHLGLAISPDIDTALYTLAGLSNRELGWGQAEETWQFMEAIAALGGPDWFRLGDRDLATHVLRTSSLAAGQTLTDVTARLASAWGIEADILPMSDAPVRTMVETDAGRLAFQTYFVAEQCRPIVRAIAFEGADAAAPAPGVVEAIMAADAVFIAPSNPYLSVAPLLAVAGIRDALAATRAPVVAISPLVGGQAVKGPTAKIMAELGVSVTNQTIADTYHGLIDGLVIHDGDAGPDGVAAASTDILMRSQGDKARVARHALDFAARLAR